jgi:hypothetical protein
MADILEQVQRGIGGRNLRFYRHADRELLAFQTIGRNGDWAVEIAFDSEERILTVRSALPLTVRRLQRHAIAELASRINSNERDILFGLTDNGERMICRSCHRLSRQTDARSIVALVENHIAAVDRHLPSFFAVAAGGQTPAEAIDQMARVRRFA